MPQRTMGARGARAARPQPQTTGEPGRGHFTRHSRRSERPAYSAASQALGASLDNPLAAAPGYLRYLDITLNGGSGANATTNTVAGVAGNDVIASGATTGRTSILGSSPAGFVNFIQVKDAYGTPVFSGNGYEMLYLVPMFSGQVGISAASDLNKWPSVSTAGLATGTATTVTGNFFYHARVPFEIVPAYGVLAAGNASLQPQLHLQLATGGQVWATAPSTSPTVTVTVDENYWSVPVDHPDIEPEGLGTTLQWTQVTANPTVGSASSQRIQLPRTGGYLTTLILEARDTTGARNDAVWPALGSNNRIRLYLDGVPVLDEQIEERIDQMYETFGGANQVTSNAFVPGTANVFARPAGVIAYSFKTSESQMNLGFMDSGDLWLSSTPGTLIEVECTPWGSFSNGPATITAIIGQIVPRGRVAQGLDVQ